MEDGIIGCNRGLHRLLERARKLITKGKEKRWEIRETFLISNILQVTVKENVYSIVDIISIWFIIDK